MEKYFFGLAGASKAYFVLDKFPTNGVVVVIVEDDNISETRDDFFALSRILKPAPVYSFPSLDHFERLTTLNNLSIEPNAVIITSLDALREETISIDEFKKELINIELGCDYKFDAFIQSLSNIGYRRSVLVEEKGQFSRRGDIVDIWPPDQNLPWRLSFNNNTLESLRSFDIVTQRSGQFLNKEKIIPAKELKESNLTDYLPDNTLIYIDIPEYAGIPENFSKYDKLINSAAPDAGLGAAGAGDAGFRLFYGLAGNQGLFLDELKKFIEKEFMVMIFCSNEGEKERVEDILFENKIPECYELAIGRLSAGFYSQTRKLAVFSSQEMLYKKPPVSFPKFKTGRRLEGLWEISPRDYIVHEKYGIGRYLGLKKISRGEQEAEYLCIEYKGGDKLYVPTDEFRVVQKYIGVEGYRPRLFSLDTFAWERAKQRAKEGAKEMAEELLKLYAARSAVIGHAFEPDNHWEKELSDSFPYEETQDQLKAIEEVKQDLEKQKPMERLICGDVGYGKTEVAVRAAFKVVQDSKQAAVLVPTTVLAEQHFQTFSTRLGPFPVNLQVLSRFQQKKEQKKIIEGISSGLVDIVIGTHRILQKDVKFKDLGLVIIDEEHRFGVGQKEKMKYLKKNVDVLLLSATPIPRTLSISLSGLRDLSIIETPPCGRQPIETHLGPYDDKIVKKIIQAELSRGGQVFYVYNRVETILSRASYLKKLMPEMRWGIVHGQMKPSDIEKTMWEFLHRKIDVLIATTIIESGLDIPSVNTMIVEEAENFGLAQLYQLRGRIGREKQKAYCYLFYTPSQLSEDSTKRLKALQEFNELGSGFRLALRDLEIRGAGNILSSKQHGFVREIGFELYGRLLEEASKKLRGADVSVETPKEEQKTTLDFLVSAHIPSDYIETEDLRIIFYRRMTNAKSQTDLDEIASELVDRFGKFPLPVENLFELAQIKLLAEKAAIKSITEDDNFISLYFSERQSFTPEKILKLANDYSGILEFIRSETPGIKLKKTLIPSPLFQFLKSFLANL